MPKEYVIELSVKDPVTNELIGKRTALSFEGAEEDLGKLRRVVEKLEDEADEDVPEEVEEEMEE